MEIKETLFIKDIDYEPFDFDFIGNYIVIYCCSYVYIYDIKGNLICEIDRIHGNKGAINILPNNLFSVSYFGNKIYDNNGDLTKKRLKATKKSIENASSFSFPPTIYNSKIYVGFIKGGLIGIYDENLNVEEHILLEKNEQLVNINFNEKKALIHNKKTGIIDIAETPTFKRLKKFKINKQNESLIFHKNLILNFGYTSSIFLIDIDNEKTEKFYFHPTSKKGYKEQYEGTNNFGSNLINYDSSLEVALISTDKNRSFLFDFKAKSHTELEINKVFNFNPYTDFGGYYLNNGLFFDNKLYSNIAEHIVIWDLKGRFLAKFKNIGRIRKGIDNKIYSLKNNNIYKLDIL